MEIASGVLRLTVPSAWHGKSYQYLVGLAEGELLLLRPGAFTPGELDGLRRQYPRLQVGASWLDTDLLRAEGHRVDRWLDGGESFSSPSGSSWRTIPVPGEREANLMLWREATGTAVLGQAVGGWGVPAARGRSLVAPPQVTNTFAYLETISRLESMPISTLLTAYRPPLSGAALALFWHESRAACAAISAAVEMALDEMVSGGTLDEICRYVGREVHRWPAESWWALGPAVQAHLDVIVEEALVDRMAALEPAYRRRG